MIQLPTLGFRLDEPSPSDWGSQIDNVPSPANSADIATANRMWRREVEAELLGRLESGRLSVWFPVALPSQQPVVPLIGGNPSQDWAEALDVLIMQAIQGGAGQVRVVDLTRHCLWKQQRDRLLTDHADVRVISASLAPRASSSDVYRGLDLGGMIALIVDVLRADDSRTGRNTAAMLKSALEDVSRVLGRSEASLTVLRDAVRYALSLDPTVTSLDRSEMKRLDAYHHRHVQTRQGLGTDLDQLDRLMSSVARFSPVVQPDARGTRKQHAVILRGIAPGLANMDHELAADLLASRLSCEMSQLDSRHDLTTILIGADKISEATLSAITSASIRRNSLLFVFYERFAGLSLNQIGSAGASVGGFFRLGNSQEALAAAEFMGKQYKFELTGYSLNESRSFEWGWSKTVGSDRSTSRSWDFGRSFSRVLSSSVSSSTSSTNTQGSGSSTGSSIDMQRVYEYLLDPSIFQSLPPASLLIVDVASRTASLASCSRDVQRSKLVSQTHYCELGS